MEVIRYKTSKNSGDTIAALPGIQQVYKDTGRKGVIIQRLGLEAYYYDGANHPLKNENGVHVCMNQQQWDMLVPLLESQEYIDHCEIFTGQHFDIDFDRVMHDRQIPLPGGDIHHWTVFIAPELACDLSIKWLEFERLTNHSDIYWQVCGKILINKTERYGNPHITYFFLKQYENKLVFAGTEYERNLFCSTWNIDIPHLKVNNFLELAQAIHACKVFLGVQSMCWHIADALKVPRILESCSQFPNCHPTGAAGYPFIHQQALELYVHKLFNS
jgi:hypothetical protein